MIKKCAVCGKEFEVDRRIKYCSDECRAIGQNKIPKKAKCIVCGKEFVRVDSSKSCSKECKEIHYKQRQAEYRARNKERIKKLQHKHYIKHREEILDKATNKRQERRLEKGIKPIDNKYEKMSKKEIFEFLDNILR